MRLPRRRLATLGAVALVGLGGVVTVNRPSGSNGRLEVRAAGVSTPQAPGEPVLRPAGPPAVATGADAGAASSSSSTTARRPAPAVPITLGRLTTTSAPTTATTIDLCAPTAPVYAFGLARRPDGNGWAAGANPALQRSSNGGQAWAPACLPADAVAGTGALYGIVFDPDGLHGWVVGGSGGRPVVLRTVDGGGRWLAGALPDGLAGGLTDVAFADLRRGWAAGNLTGTGPANAAGGLLLATGDGGATWTTQAIPPGIGRLNRISIVDATHGWAVGVGSGGRPVVVATTDGGITWSSQTLPEGIRELRDIEFIDRHRGWAVGALPAPLAADAGIADPGVVLTTADGGATWTEQARTAGSLWSLAVVDARTVFAGGGYGLFSTGDGGATWQKQPFALPALEAISFTDATHGWVTHSMFSTICRTDDGGRTWVASDVRIGGRPSRCLP